MRLAKVCAAVLKLVSHCYCKGGSDHGSKFDQSDLIQTIFIFIF